LVNLHLVYLLLVLLQFDGACFASVIRLLLDLLDMKFELLLHSDVLSHIPLKLYQHLLVALCLLIQLGSKMGIDSLE
jgi:hypothetical protein